MDLPADKIVVLSSIAWLAIFACFGVWGWVFFRRNRKLPVLPVAWRRPVPWRGIDLAIFIFVYIFLLSLISGIVDLFTDGQGALPPKDISVKAPVATEADPPKPSVEVVETVKPKKAKSQQKQKESAHEVVLALRSGDPWMIVVCFFMAVIYAPICEEIVFRMFIQGYLEKVDAHLRVQLRSGRIMNPYTGQIESQSSLLTILPWGVSPILITSFVFAMMHFRPAQETPPIEEVRWAMVAVVLAGTISVVALLFWLRLFRGARLSDFGIVPREIPRDIFRGLVAFAAVAAPIYAIQILATYLVPKDYAPDPVSIFFLSVAFGTVWCRTHRLVPSVVMHMSLNAASLALALYAM